MNFVPMTTIKKRPSKTDTECTDWIATEKVHGCNFQFFTDDGQSVYLSSRRVRLDAKGSFMRCDLAEFHQRHKDYVTRIFHTVKTGDEWSQYRSAADLLSFNEADAEIQEDGSVGQGESVNAVDEEMSDIAIDTSNIPETTPRRMDGLELRIYGELYGGGGVHTPAKFAVQKEILYTDEFRFYVFGININQKWTTVLEMNQLCQQAGFPIYATPVCDPKKTVDELQEFLTASGFMESKSRLTESNENSKIFIEGVVMTPLTRPDHDFHAVKFLSPAFRDVRILQYAGNGQTTVLDYCTKARYLSVLSKLDLHERQNGGLVVRMFIEDIRAEGGDAEVTEDKKEYWTRSVKAWLISDGYLSPIQSGQWTREAT